MDRGHIEENNEESCYVQPQGLTICSTRATTNVFVNLIASLVLLSPMGYIVTLNRGRLASF